MNNGNCSEFCVWLPGQPHVCSCQCGKRLRAPGYQCEDINICNIDMLVAVDVGNGLDQRGCFFNNFTASSSLAVSIGFNNLYKVLYAKCFMLMQSTIKV